MATIKSFTDLSQSKTLGKILPPESADMYWWYSGKRYYIEAIDDGDFNEKGDIRAWSLAALLDIIPKHIKDYNVLRMDISEKDFSIWYDEVGYGVNNKLPNITMECPVDACVVMIEKLHKLKML